MDADRWMDLLRARRALFVLRRVRICEGRARRDKLVSEAGRPDAAGVAPDRRRFHASVPIAALVLAFLLTIAYIQQQDRTRATTARRDQLAALVVDREKRTSRIEKELLELRSRADALRLRGSGPAAALQREIERLSALAGITPVRGEGLIVTLGDSPVAGDPPDFQIQDVDVQLVVNELWNVGAEAIAVNGQRIVATSAVRSAGHALLVNYKVLTSPYRIDAIGSASTMKKRFAASSVAQQFRTWSQLYRLSIAVKASESIRLPAYGGRISLSHAEAAAS